MNKIDNLIKELCPNGVEYKRIGDICYITRGKVMSKQFLSRNFGEYPVYSSQTENNGIFGKINKYDFDGEYVQWTTDGAKAGSIFYRNGKFSVTNVCGLLKINECNVDKINTKFLSYILGFISKKYVNYATSNPKLMSNVVSDIEIPVPPIDVQNEIVKILDKFSTLEAELEAELEAREKQYEFWREKLLNNSTNMIKLKDIAFYSKDRIPCKSLNDNNYIGVDNLLQNKLGKSKSNYVPKIGNCTRYEKNDILIGNIRPYLKKIWLSTNVGGTNGDVLTIRTIHSKDISSKYLYYVLSSDDFFRYDIINSKGAKMPRGDKLAIMNYKLYLPPIETQNRIVTILDKFDRLINDINEGIPAEIELRKKQYEYYRDKLLSFEAL